MDSSIFNQLQDLLVFMKDKEGRFTYGNEMLARNAGVDSIEEVLGKTDYDMPWRKHADFFKASDRDVMAGAKFEKVVENFTVADNRKITLLATKGPRYNDKGECIGIIGYAIDITGFQLKPTYGVFDERKRRFYLGEEFNNAYLTFKEFRVLQYILNGYSAKRAGLAMGLSKKTVETHILHIKNKLQCATKGDIIATAIQHGLTHIVDDFAPEQPKEAETEENHSSDNNADVDTAAVA